MYYIGLDVHKKTISYCVKDASGRICQEGKVGATRWELDIWIKTLPQPWTVAMEATIFTGWIYDHLKPHAADVKVAHPLMLRAIAASKKKNDSIDAGKIADCLRCDFLPECYMRQPRFGNAAELSVPASAGAANGSDEESRIRFADGNWGEPQQGAITQSGLFPGVAGERRCGEREYSSAVAVESRVDHAIAKAIICSLQRDPLLAERVRRLQTIPAVGKVTALSWALEMGNISRFRSIRQAISYCGLCGDEKRSADKVARTPISKQRNKHIQRVLVEAAKLAPRRNPDLALVYENARQKGNANCATLAVARKLVAYLMAVDREQRDFEPLREFGGIAA